MAKFVLKRREPETFDLEIDGETYRIPLAEYLTPAVNDSLNTAEGTRAFFNGYLPEEITKSLTVAEYNDITKAWVKASKKAGE